jgi:hypothetical protein
LLKLKLSERGSWREGLNLPVRLKSNSTDDNFFTLPLSRNDNSKLSMNRDDDNVLDNALDDLRKFPLNLKLKLDPIPPKLISRLSTNGSDRFSVFSSLPTPLPMLLPLPLPSRLLLQPPLPLPLPLLQLSAKSQLLLLLLLP